MTEQVLKEPWACGAIKHGVTIFPNGKIGPCCQIDPSYLKPISEIHNEFRFHDLVSSLAPPACRVCVMAEHNVGTSHRRIFNKLVTDAPGIQFLDIRNTNLCNLKCRYCGPHFSNQWGEELNETSPLQHAELDEYKKVILTDSLQHIYFTGGEPIISGDHWNILEQLIVQGNSQYIALMYNSNLTVLKYKNKDIFDIWKNFKSVRVNCSIDAIGKPLNYIRSNSDWNVISENLYRLLEQTQIKLVLSPVISVLNLWFLVEFAEFASKHKLKIEPIVLEGPDYLALDVIPNSLKTQALEIVQQLESMDFPQIKYIKHKIVHNQHQNLFKQTLTHIIFLDNLRGEKLLKLLPFTDIAKNLILKNNEYKQ